MEETEPQPRQESTQESSVEGGSQFESNTTEDLSRRPSNDFAMFRPFDREVFVSPEDDMFAASIPPTQYRLRPSDIPAVARAPLSSSDTDDDIVTTTRRQIRVTSGERRSPVDLPDPRNDDTNRVSFGFRRRAAAAPERWFLTSSTDSEWIRRCRTAYRLAEAVSLPCNTLHPWESFISPILTGRDVEPLEADLEPLDILSSGVEPSAIESTVPSQFQIPVTGRDTSSVSTEITAFDLCHGADPQGIRWGSPWVSRQSFRHQRLQNIEMQSDFRSMTAEACAACVQQVQQNRTSLHVASRQQTRYHFWRTMRCDPKPTADHVQLRHLLHAITSTDVVLANTSTQSARLACGALNTTTGKINWIHGRRLRSPTPRMRGIASLHSRFGFAALGFLDSRVSVSDLGRNYEALYWDEPEPETFIQPERPSRRDSSESFFRHEHRQTSYRIDENLGLNPREWYSQSVPRGEEQPIIWRGRKVLNLLRISEEDDNIVNCVSLETGSWAADGEIQDVSLYTACNDHTVAEWTLCGRLKWRVTLPWCANHFAISPCKRLISIGADSRRVVMLDLMTKRPVLTLEGHQDYTFSSSWHPDPNSFLFATGNQDSTCRIWDIRNPNAPLFILGGACSAVRCVSFSPDGQTLAFAESKDIVCLYDVQSQFQDFDCIDFFGEPTGLSFSPDSSRLFAGIAEPDYGGVVEMRRGLPQGTLSDEIHRRTRDLANRVSSEDTPVSSIELQPSVDRSDVEKSHVPRRPDWLGLQHSIIRSLYNNIRNAERGEPETITSSSSTNQILSNIADDASKLLSLESNPIASESEHSNIPPAPTVSIDSSSNDPTSITDAPVIPDEDAMDYERLGSWIASRSVVQPAPPFSSTDLLSSQSIEPRNILPAVPSPPTDFNPLADWHGIPSLLEQESAADRAGWMPLWDPTTSGLTAPTVERTFITRRLGMPEYE